MKWPSWIRRRHTVADEEYEDMRRQRNLAEAEQQALAKQAKLQTALSASQVDDYHKLAADDRWSAAAYRDKKLFGITPQRKGQGEKDVIVADDVRIGGGTSPWVIGLIALLAILAGTALAFILLSDPTPPSTTVVNTQDTDTDTDTIGEIWYPTD